MPEQHSAPSVDELVERIREGLDTLPGLFVGRQAAFVRKQQARDGGFPGRQGGSDLYYTSFGTRLMDVVCPDDEKLRSGIAGWLERRGAQVKDAVEALCLLDSLHILGRYGDAPEALCREADAAVSTVLEARRTEGGWAKEPGGAPSVYHTFLSDICYARLDLDMPNAEAVVAMVRERQQADGGFADLPGGASGVNPTAAAVDLLWRREALDDDVAAGARRYIGSMQTPEGGFAASEGAPCADLLSTFTGAVALGRTGIPENLKLAPLGKYVKKLAAWRGGFRGAAPDTERDVEYTWYGVALAGVLASEAARRGLR